MQAAIFIYINYTMESKKETSVKGQSTEIACFLLLTTGHILQQSQWDGIDPNPISPTLSLSQRVCLCVHVCVRTEEPKICLTQSHQDAVGIYKTTWSAQLVECVCLCICVCLTHCCFLTAVCTLHSSDTHIVHSADCTWVLTRSVFEFMLLNVMLLW